MSSTQTDVIDGVSASTAIKAPVRVATTANITLSGEQTIDGVAVVADDRVLVKDQTDTTENGIYNAAAGAWSRAADFDGNRDVRQGTLVNVYAGTVGGGHIYRCTSANPIVIDTSAITFGLLV
jgi:phage-related tail fiber protein